MSSSKTKDVFFIFSGNVLNAVSNILLMPFLARALSPYDYGTYGQVLLMVDTAQIIVSCGLATILYVVLASNPEKFRATITNNLVAAIGLGLLGYIFIQIFTDLLANQFGNIDIKKYLPIYSISIISALVLASTQSALIYLKRVKTYVFATVFSNLLRLTALFIAIQFYASLELAFWGLVAINISTMLLCMWLLRDVITLRELSLGEGKRQIRKGLALGLTGVLGYVIFYTDGIMISSLLTTKDYAFFRAGAIEIPLVATFYASVAQIILPEVSKLYSKLEFDQIISLKYKVSLNSAALVYPFVVFCIIFAPDLITAYLSEKYAASIVIFQIYSATVFIRIADYLDVLIAAQKNSIIVGVHILVIGINILLNYIFIKSFGMVGAAYSTVIAKYIFCGLLLYFTAHVLKTKVINIFDYKRFFGIILLCLSVMICTRIVSSPLESIWMRLMAVSLSLPVVFLIIVKFGYIDSVILARVKNKVNFLARSNG